MTAHGFRVYVVRAYKNRKKDRDPEQLHYKSDTALEIVGLLEQLEARETVFLEPAPPAADSDEPPKRPKTVTISAVTKVNESMVHFEFHQGEVGERPRGRHRTQPAIELEDWSAEIPHYVAFLFPKAPDDRMLIVAQTIRRRDEVDLLLRVLGMQSAQNKKKAEEDENAARAAAKAAGVRPSAREAHWRLLFDRVQAADSKYLDEIIGSASSAAVEFESRTASPRGGAADVVQRKLRIALLDEKEKDISSRVGRSWWTRRQRGEAVTAADGVSEVTGLLAEEGLMDQGEAQIYQEVAVVLKGKNGVGTRITVDTIRDVFTYPVSDGRPFPYQHYKKVAPRVEIIAAEEELEVDSIDPMEVDQCLSD
jgi:hypothetical protein